MWERDGLGRPYWIAAIPDSEWAPWSEVIPPPLRALEEGRFAVDLRLGGVDDRRGAMPSVGPDIMRRLLPQPAEKPRGGRPRVEVRDPAISVWIAWLVDMCDRSLWSLTRQIAPWVFDPPVPKHTRSKVQSSRAHLYLPNERSARRYVERRLSAGRLLLHENGVIPWAAWPQGRLPTGWWTTRLFQVALEGWYDAYVIRAEPAITAAKEAIANGATKSETARVYLRQLKAIAERASARG